MPPKALPLYVDVEVSDTDAVEWPLYVEVHYTDEDVEGLDEESLGIYYWKAGAWHRCGDTGVDAERNVAWAYMTVDEASGSPILVGGTPPKPAEFILSSLSITPAEVKLGEEATITFTVTNVGEETGVRTVKLSVEGEPVTFVVTLEGGESEKLEFKYTPETEGTYNVEVDGLTGSFEAKAVIVPPKPAEFEISNLVVSPSEVVEGEPVTVTVNIENTGEMEGSHTVTLKLDGVETETKEVTLEGGSSTTTLFTLTEAAGEYTVTVDGLTASFTVTAPKKLPWSIIIGVLILIIAAGVYIYLRYIKTS
ncbi:MAG: CARDB domain-containing protein [Promethearchaeota archaeon]